MFHANKRCLRCGRDSHWVNNCYAKTNIFGDINNRHTKHQADYSPVQEFANKQQTEFSESEESTAEYATCSESDTDM